ncbi:hypothetical protein NL676_039236 [Syzygium grande]|nr:hypothetical protein NL676_039236 [Syzygium grande]
MQEPHLFFLASLAIHLTQLEELKIHECGIVELIEKEGLVPRDVFPRLTSLKLEHLTELKCIYTPIHALRWPALKTLEVNDCNKVEILALQPENEMPLHKQPLFTVEKGAFSNLQELKLNLFNGMEIWHGTFLNEEFFCKLRVLELREVIMEEGSKEGQVVAFKHLKYMELDRLIGLRCFSSSGHTLMFPLLEDVTVTRCPNMKFFSKGPIEAPKLERVQVSRVGWFWKENLNITIQSMFEQMQLKTCFRSIDGSVPCQSNTYENKGVCSDGRSNCRGRRAGSTVEMIAFLNLEEMELECLPHLTSFLSGKNHMLYCPRLEKADHHPLPQDEKFHSAIFDGD